MLAKAPQLKAAVTAQPWSRLLGPASHPEPAPSDVPAQPKASSSQPINSATDHPVAATAAADVQQRNAARAAVETGEPTEGEQDDADVSDSEDEAAPFASDAPPSGSAPLSAKPQKPSEAARLEKPSKVRQLEWQALWLQLRIKELGWQTHRASRQLRALEASQPAAPQLALANAASTAAVQHVSGGAVPMSSASAQAGQIAATGTSQHHDAAQLAQPQAAQIAPAVDVPGEKPVTLEGMIGPPAHDLAPPSASQPVLPVSAFVASLRQPPSAHGEPAAYPTVPATATSLENVSSEAVPSQQQGQVIKRDALSTVRQGSVEKRARRSKPRGQRQPLPSLRALQQHPFFAPRAGHAQVDQLPAQGPREEQGNEEAWLLPACVHWGLEQLGKRIAASKRLLLQTQVGYGAGPF